jgi:AcrR family transcriptional regulator
MPSTPEPRQNRRSSRRDQYAQATRQAIIDAGRKLFAEQGYFATKVDDIAAEADVAPATVYAVVGGKQGLLTELRSMWTTEPAITTSLAFIDSADNPESIIRYIAHASRQRREQFGDVMRILLDAAPQDPAIADQLRPATELYRATVVKMAQRIDALGGLRDGVDVDLAADVLWFYFGYQSYFTLHEDDGWTYERAEHWLADEACAALLRR